MQVSTTATNASSKSAQAAAVDGALVVSVPVAQVSTAEVANRYPRNSDPESPMKIRAGAQLCTRKAAHPAATAISSAANSRCPVASASRARKGPVTRPMPAAAPSELSSRLNEFVRTTIQATVPALPITDRSPDAGENIYMYAGTTTGWRAQHSAITRTAGLSGRRSSVRPRRTRSPPRRR